MEKRKRGRPIKYDKTMHNVALALAKKGSTDAEICEIIGISTTTLYEWKKREPEFAETLKQNKYEYDVMVEDALVKRALGMTVKKVLTKSSNGNVTRTVVEEELPPDTTALALYLRNRMPEKWCREKQVIEQKNSYDIQIGLTSEEIRRIIKEDPINQSVVVEAGMLELDEISVG